MDEAVREPEQPELPLPAPPLPADMPPLPARMVNEYQYCPRLAYLEWVQGEWADSADTADGRFAHRRVEQASGTLPAADDINDDDRLHVRSLTLAAERLGLIARMDLIEVEDGAVIPVDYKRGKRPHVASGAYDPERVQLCVRNCSRGWRFFGCARLADVSQGMDGSAVSISPERSGEGRAADRAGGAD